MVIVVAGFVILEDKEGNVAASARALDSSLMSERRSARIR